MNVEKEIAGFALPFTGGVLVTAYIGAQFCDPSSFTNIIFLSIILGTVMLLWQRLRFKREPWETWILIGMAAMGCGALCAATDMILLGMPESGVMKFCHGFGLRMQSVIDNIPFKSDDTSALIKALLTGERSSLSSEIKTAFRDSGASHILALSGMHLGIIYGILSWVLSLLGNTTAARILRPILIITACGSYTLATGAGDSLVRAYIFIILREVAKMTSRYHGLGQILLASLVVQLIIDPLAIRSISFQLSYSAMAGIAFVHPYLQELWERAAELFKDSASEDESDISVSRADIADWSRLERVAMLCGRLVERTARWIWNTVTLSIACQITTAPLAYMYFDTFPLYFMLTNLLTLPLTGLLIPAALLTAVLSITGYSPAILIHTTEWLASSLIWLLKVISAM